MLSDEQLARVAYEIETLGFSVVDDVVDPAFAVRLRGALMGAMDADMRLFGDLPGKRADLVNNLTVHGGPFIDLLDNAVMHQVFAQFLGPSHILYNYGSTVLLPGEDSPAAQIHVDTPRLIPNYHAGLIMTLALDDFRGENGATFYLPGSQNHENKPSEAVFAHYATSVARGAGAAVFFNPRCWHRAGFNRSAAVRCGLTIYAVRAFMKQRFDFPRMIGAEAAAAMTEQTRRFLGFDARVPAAMTEFYVEPSARLYKANQG